MVEEEAAAGLAMDGEPSPQAASPSRKATAGAWEGRSGHPVVLELWTG